jgi:TP901 family phage tail tape measure protein
MEQLRTAALNAGRDTAFSATEAADAEGELVKAGVSVKDVLAGALTGALGLAAAGQLNLADAATISANAMNTFGLKGADVAHIADVYAAAANKSAADVSTLAYAMQQGGLVAAQTGLSFEDTTAVLAAFADRGLQGADAGTSLKTMLEKLNAPTSQAADLMANLGITTYDANGKFVGITAVAGELHDKLGQLTDQQRNQALATIFGSDAIRAASVLYNLGADGVKGYTQAVNDQGAAGRMAAEQMNNLSGDLHQLRGSIETDLIKSGSGANDSLRGMAQGATKAANAFGALPSTLQEVGVGLAGGAGSALLMVGGLTTLAGKLGSTKKTLAEAAEASTGFKAAMASAGSFMVGPWGLAVAGATAALGILISQHHQAKVEIASFTDALKADGDAYGDATTKAVANDLASRGLLETYSKLGLSVATVTDAALGDQDALNQVAAATDKAVAATDTHSAAGLRAAAALLNGKAVIQSYKDALTGQLHAEQQATAASQNSAAATGTSAAESAKAAQAAKDLAGAQLIQSGGQRAVFEAENAIGAATATTTTKKKASADASDLAATAAHHMAESDNDGTQAAKKASDAADAHTTALYKTAASAQAAADAATKNKSANASEATATATAAEAAAQAAEVHQLGTRWLLSVADAEAGAAGSARDLDSSVKDEVSAMQDAQNTAGSLKLALDALNGVHISASKAAVDEQQKVADLTKAFADNGKSLDITTEAGRKNITAIDDMATAANAHANAVASESGSIEAGNKALDASRTEFDAVLKSAGFSTAQIDTFNKTLLNTPKLADVTLDVHADTSSAAAALQSLENKYAGTGLTFGGGPSGKRIISGFSTGGLVTGAGGPTSDSNTIAVSNLEYVVRADKVAQPGVLAELNAINFGTGSTTVVKPQLPMHQLPAAATAASGGRGAALNIESYYENGASPQQIAAELSWLTKSRGGSW